MNDASVMVCMDDRAIDEGRRDPNCLAAHAIDPGDLRFVPGGEGSIRGPDRERHPHGVESLSEGSRIGGRQT